MPPKRKWFCRLWLSSYPYLTDTYTCFSWCLSTALSSPPPLIAHLLVSPPHYAWKQNKSCDRPYGCANLDCLCNLKRLQVLFHVPVMTRTSTKSKTMLKINKQKREWERCLWPPPVLHFYLDKPNTPQQKTTVHGPNLTPLLFWHNFWIQWQLIIK